MTMTKTKQLRRPDGRKLRWVDCGWDDKTDGCGACQVCKYQNFIDWAESCCGRSGIIERDSKMEKYLNLKGREKKAFIYQLLCIE